MEYITGTREFQLLGNAVVTLGKFDGRHRGHRKLLEAMIRLKEDTGYEAAVFTFGTPPGNLVMKQDRKMITTNQERKNNMEKLGIDFLVEYPFTEEVSRMEAEEFVSRVLVNQMNARILVVGTDCGFGHKRAGNVELLKTLEGRYGYRLVVIEKEKDHQRDISSTYIKEEMERGNMEKANELLGECFSIHGTVVHGRHLGGTILGFPTANLLPPKEKYLPPFGVYVSRVLVNGESYGGITNIGKKPTVEGENPIGVETFLFGLDADLYGKNIEVQLLHFVRSEKKFQNLETLRNQIERDKQTGEDYLEALDKQKK